MGLTRVKNNTLCASLFLTQLSAWIRLILWLPQLGQGRGQLLGAAGTSIQITVPIKALIPLMQVLITNLQLFHFQNQFGEVAFLRVNSENEGFSITSTFKNNN